MIFRDTCDFQRITCDFNRITCDFHIMCLIFQNIKQEKKNPCNTLSEIRYVRIKNLNVNKI